MKLTYSLAAFVCLSAVALALHSVAESEDAKASQTRKTYSVDAALFNRIVNDLRLIDAAKRQWSIKQEKTEGVSWNWTCPTNLPRIDPMLDTWFDSGTLAERTSKQPGSPGTQPTPRPNQHRARSLHKDGRTALHNATRCCIIVSS